MVSIESVANVDNTYLLARYKLMLAVEDEIRCNPTILGEIMCACY